ncbi:MAG: peptide chain release factor 1 [Candidatus Omnitrophica bacterium]|nr:peptide chain release factor 1 [Candidatus Omnitrophota bacterium]
MSLDKFRKFKDRFLELEKLLADPAIIADQAQYQKLAKEYSSITPTANAFDDYAGCLSQIEDLKKMLQEKHDADFEELAKSELKEMELKSLACLERLQYLTNPQNQEADKDLIVEIRAGTGGGEASLFAADLYRMYTKYADKKGWKVEAMGSHESEAGGFKEVVFSVSGKGAAKYLKWESGTHRVQRVPTTEASGRIHTSAATVAVLFEPEEVDIEINPNDVRIDVFRSSGPGGQSVNTTDSAVRLTHIPTGMVVVCQDERSQLKNKAKAFRVLRARLMDKMKQDSLDKASQDRKLKIGSGDRSEKIRTYNFPDRRITDHRIGFTTYQLANVMDGDLDEMTEALLKAEYEESLAQ